MARAFLLHFLGAYLFSNGRQMVQLRWLALFQEFGEAWKANQGQTCLAYLYSTLNTLSRGTLQQLVGSWKLLEVSYLFILCTFICSFQSCKLCNLENCYLASVILQTVIFHLTCGLCFFFAMMGCQVWSHNSRHQPSLEGFSLSEGLPCGVNFG